MGNAMAAVVKRDRRHLWVKIMKSDGTVTKLLSPVSVKEVLSDKPDHGIFEADAVRQLGVGCRPLPQTVQLDGGRMYFLIPLPPQPSSQRLLTASCRLRQLELFREAFSLGDLSTHKVDRDEKKNRDVGIFLSVGEESKVRVKLRLRKDELHSIASGNGNLSVEAVVEKAIEMMKQKKPGDSMCRPVNSGWKHKLDSIAESKSLAPAA